MLCAGDKLKVANALIQQLLTHASTRDFIEDNFDRLRQTQKDLRNHQANGQKRDRDETFYWSVTRLDLLLTSQTRDQNKTFYWSITSLFLLNLMAASVNAVTIDRLVGCQMNSFLTQGALLA